MNIARHVLVVGVLIAVTIILSLRLEQRRWGEERKQELKDFDQ